MVSFAPSMIDEAISEFSIMIRPVADHDDNLVLRLGKLDAEAAGNLIAHAGETVFHVIGARRALPPDFVQFARQAARRADHGGGRAA